MFRAMGKFLVAALVVALIIALISYTLIPNLSQYISKTLPSEKNLELVSVVASDPDSEHAEPADGDIYENMNYSYTYDAGAGGWNVAVKDKTKTKYSPLNETIYGKPVLSINATFKDCTALTQAPAVPSTVKDMTSAFAGCSSLTGTITIYATPEQYSNCFTDTVESIVLTGNDAVLPDLSATSVNGNIIIK